MDQFEALIKEIYTSVREDSFAKLTLSKPSEVGAKIKKVIIRMIMIKEKRHFSFVSRYSTKDITKNFNVEDGTDKIIQMMQSDYEIANLFTNEQHIAAERLEDGSFKLKRMEQSTDVKNSRSHDKEKQSLLSRQDYLKALGILNKKGHIQKDKGDKYKQINKFVEIIDGILRKNKALDGIDPLRIVDMGSGKGYLTFALYDYLKNTKSKNISLKGIEMRLDLVELCTKIAKEAEFDQLSFEQGTIQEMALDKIDALIALHACDTATDDAIYKGIKANASLIICSPCCHKQVRRSMKTSGTIASITQFGILMERQAELVTDTIRALLLQKHGYKSNVFEFISTEHTGKNIMITAIKDDGVVDTTKIQKEIDDLKALFGVEEHYLETLLA